VKKSILVQKKDVLQFTRFKRRKSKHLSCLSTDPKTLYEEEYGFKQNPKKVLINLLLVINLLVCTINFKNQLMNTIFVMSFILNVCFTLS